MSGKKNTLPNFCFFIPAQCRRTCHKLTQRSKLTRIIFSFVFCKKKRSFFYAKSECCHFMSCLEHVHPSLTWPLLLENSKNANLVKKKYNPSSSKNSTHPLLICSDFYVSLLYTWQGLTIHHCFILPKSHFLNWPKNRAFKTKVSENGVNTSIF